MTLADVDWLEKNDPERFWEYYSFVLEKIMAEQRENQKAIDKVSGGSSGSDTFRFPEDHVSDVGEDNG